MPGHGLFLVFLTLMLLNPDQELCRMSSNLGLFAVLSGLDRGYRFWGLASGVKYPFLLHHLVT